MATMKEVRRCTCGYADQGGAFDHNYKCKWLTCNLDDINIDFNLVGWYQITPLRVDDFRVRRGLA